MYIFAHRYMAGREVSRAASCSGSWPHPYRGEPSHVELRAMFNGVSELCIELGDDGSPTAVASGSAPGESGVLVFGARFQGQMRLSATPRRHHVYFQFGSRARFDCHIAGRALLHWPQTGSIAICPAGADYSVNVEGSIAAILVAVDPSQFALAAAESASLEAQLIERLSGHDQTLLDLAQRLTLECASNYPNGPFFWNAAASAFVDGLLARHSAKVEAKARGNLSMGTLDRIRNYVLAHLDEPIDVAALANIAGRSSFHFTRVFTRSVGVSPYRYVVYLRLRRALELVRDGGCSLAEIAAATGFADQSHLSRWVRRVHGVSPAQLAA